MSRYPKVVDFSIYKITGQQVVPALYADAVQEELKFASFNREMLTIGEIVQRAIASSLRNQGGSCEIY